MKIKELRVKNETELKRLLVETQEKVRVMRFKVAQRQLKKVHEVKNVKRDIGRILLVLKEKLTSVKENNS